MWYCALVLCSGGGGESAGGTASGSPEAFVLPLKSSGFLLFGVVQLLSYSAACVGLLIVTRRGKMRFGTVSEK